MNPEQSIEIIGQAGVLEAAFQPNTETKTGVLVCHPHPLFEGTMHNKVVTTLTRAAASQGLPTLRFNFRGVGRSEGEHDHGQGEQQDVLSVMDYAQHTLGWEKIVLAGFSFGSGMACLAAGHKPASIAGLFLLAPPVHHFDAPNQLPFDFETFIYFGDADEVVPVDEMQDWANRVIPSPHITVFKEGSHFFHGLLIDLKKIFLQDLNTLF